MKNRWNCIKLKIPCTGSYCLWVIFSGSVNVFDRGSVISTSDTCFDLLNRYPDSF